MQDEKRPVYKNFAVSIPVLLALAVLIWKLLMAEGEPVKTHVPTEGQLNSETPIHKIETH
jgi:hypothetical protein